jgi:hypothetical protein
VLRTPSLELYVLPIGGGLSFDEGNQAFKLDGHEIGPRRRRFRR